VWRIVYSLKDHRQPPETVAQGSVGYPTLEMALAKLMKRLHQAVGGGIDLREQDLVEEYRLEAVLILQPWQNNSSHERPSQA